MNKMISFLLLIICGCKVNKEKSELQHTARQSQSRLETSTSWGQFNSQDSSYRYWHYTGDSSFFFHPDLGLWSRSGQIAYGEQRALQLRVTGITLHYDSLGEESNKAQSQTQVKIVSSPKSSLIVWLLVIIPLIFATYFYWRK